MARPCPDCSPKLMVGRNSGNPEAEGFNSPPDCSAVSELRSEMPFPRFSLFCTIAHLLIVLSLLCKNLESGAFVGDEQMSLSCHSCENSL